MNIKMFALMVGLVGLVACGGVETAVEEPAEEAAEEEPMEEAAEEEAAETTPVTDASMLVGGTWFNGSNQGVYLQFSDDGTWIGAFERDRLPDAPDMQGVYRFEDGQLVIEDTGYSDLISLRDQCGESVGTYIGEIRDNGRLYFDDVDEECEPRMRSLASVLGHARLDE